MRSAILFVSLIAAALVAGCVTSATVGRASSETSTPPLATTPPAAAPDEKFTPPEPLPPLSVKTPVTEPLPGGVIDWTGNVVRARGTGVLDPGNTNKAQARLMAERAAVVVAQRNLLEIIKGVRVDSETKVENFMTRYDVVYTHVDGIIKGARQAGPAVYDSLAGTVEVELEVSLYGARGVEGGLESVLNPGGQQGDLSAAASPAVQEFFRQYGGLVFDAGTSNLNPSLFPKIYDENGNLLLDTKDYMKYAGQYGNAAVTFVSRLDEILARPEFARQPLVLKVKEVRGRLGSDIVLGGADPDKLKWLKEGAKFLFNAGRFVVRLLL